MILLSSVVLHFLLWQHSSLRSFEAGCDFTDEARRMNKAVITTTAKTINRKIAPILIVLVLLLNEFTWANVTWTLRYRIRPRRSCLAAALSRSLRATNYICDSNIDHERKLCKTHRERDRRH